MCNRQRNTRFGRMTAILGLTISAFVWSLFRKHKPVVPPSRLLQPKRSLWPEVYFPIFITVMFAGLTVLGNLWYLREAQQNQAALTRYEVTFVEKQKAYVRFLAAVNTSFDRAVVGDMATLLDALSELELAYFSIEPFLPPGPRNEIWDGMNIYQTLCFEIAEQPSPRDEATIMENSRRVADFRRIFVETMYPVLFEENEA